MTPVRIQRKRTLGWRMPANTVYVGRGSKWGNPFVVGEAIKDQMNFAMFLWMGIPSNAWENNQPMTLDQVMSSYRRFVPEYPSMYPTWKLKGKNLACWCRLDQPCHADILLEVANR